MKKIDIMEKGILLLTLLLLFVFKQNVYADESQKEINYYQVTIAVGQGGLVDVDTEIYLSEFIEFDITFLPDEGYIVDEVVSNGTLQHMKGNTYRISELQGDMHITVTFKLKEYTVQFYANGGTMYQENQIKVKHSQKIIKPFTPVREGYTFEGWYVSKDMTGQTYNFNALTYTDTQLYAKWSVVRGWHATGSDWYFYNKDESKATGWLKDDGKWYYFGKSGAMQRGWQKIENKWYYLNSSGAMQSGWTKLENKWYYLNKSGVMQTGWAKVSGKWYYLNKTGVMQSGWIKVSGKWYYLNSSGAMQTGWTKVSGKWYYLNSSGVMQTGWLKVSGKWYYLKESGIMTSGTLVNLEGKIYRFNGSGVCMNP